jgi:methyl-accepting chemotaxis protein
MILKVKKKSFQSLWVTLAIAFSALSALVLLISICLNMYLTLQTQQKLITNEQTFIAQNAANTVKEFIQKKLDILKTTVHLGGLTDTDRQEQMLTLEKLLGFEPAFRQLALLDTQGRETVDVSRLSTLVSGRLKEHIDSNILARKAPQEIYISPVYIDRVTSEPLVIMAVPSTNIFGDFKGFLLAEVNLKFMWDLVSGIKIGNHGYAYVVNRHGKLIASDDISRVLKAENLSSLVEVNEFVTGDTATHKDSAEIAKGFKGGLVVANHAHLGTPDWAVMVELPVSEAYKTITTSLSISVTVIIISFALAITAGIYLSKKITKPIILLKDAAVKIGEGRLETRVEINKNDEIGTLAKSFNRMAEDLGKTTTSVANLHREISIRKKIEESLRKSEKRFEEVAENSGDWIWEVNAEGLYAYSSPVVEKLLGYKPAEIVGKKFFYDLFAPEVKKQLKKAAFEAFAKQEKYT